MTQAANQTPEAFFYEHAGYSYTPDKETPEQGRTRCAKALADAERDASEQGYSFEWSQDDTTNREWTEEGPEYYTWRVLCRDQDGKVQGAFGGIDFGDGGEPWGNPERRVAEAEVALDALEQTKQERPPMRN